MIVVSHTVWRSGPPVPGACVSHTYTLEYGSDTIEIQQDAVKKGQRVLLVDDLLATGGTMAAAITLLEKVGAVVVGEEVKPLSK